MNCYNKVLLDSIAREKAGLDYVCSEHDRYILDMLFKDINTYLNIDIHYIAELDSLNLVGSGSIIAQYINKFESESVRSYLIPQIVSDKIDNVEELVIELYQKFKISHEYISAAEKPAPTHIYTRYDTAISSLKPKKLKMKLLDIVNSPRDVFYLPLTSQMIASWRLPEFKDLLLYCGKDGEITREDVGLPNDNRKYYPPYEVITRQLKFIVINSLKYYPTNDTLNFIKEFLNEDDDDLNSCAEKSIAYIIKRLE